MGIIASSLCFVSGIIGFILIQTTKLSICPFILSFFMAFFSLALGIWIIMIICQENAKKIIECHKSFNITNNHQIYVQRDGKNISVKVDELQPNDKICSYDPKTNIVS